jgi:hypothetical protein
MTQPHGPLFFGDEPTLPIHKRPWFVVPAGLAAVGVLGLLIGQVSPSDPSGAAASAASTSASRTSGTSSASPSTPAPLPAQTSTAEAPAPTETSAPVDFAMPDVVGMDLQSAQDLIQTFGVFLTVSRDLLGSRNQALDSNWLVCSQNVPAGQQVRGDVEGAIDLGVVKREESCP